MFERCQIASEMFGKLTFTLGILFQLMVFILIFGWGISCWGSFRRIGAISCETLTGHEDFCMGGGGFGAGGGTLGDGGIAGGGGGGGGRFEPEYEKCLH